ncbi:hypothetical protein D2T29_12505 [Sinirhodobacter populi]|uniref:Uncharacterized protein n=1 Tax=Paenirhodobacter populi TaxID=2306993 RepID=A0A443KCM9_9RHOB|nr:hypothetical protein [Sinirhodobacter populi]RWR30485.1 hypothetical protein D2T29_12505 [Sinirhodobacter populi]
MITFYDFASYANWRDSGDSADTPVKLVGEEPASWAERYELTRQLAEAQSEITTLREKVQTLGTEGHSYRAGKIAGAEIRRAECYALRAQVEAMQGALAELERACDRLAGMRSREIYLAMIDDGQGYALAALDNARSDARAALSTPAAAAHLDDAAVDRFASAMKAKLAKKREDGRGGWSGPDCSAPILSQMLREHVEKGDPIDVANFAMMLHQRGERIESATATPQGDIYHWTKTSDSLPRKPGIRDYEQIECLIRLPNGDIEISVWNCEHEVWDDSEGDDYRYDSDYPTHWLDLAPVRAALPLPNADKGGTSE